MNCTPIVRHHLTIGGVFFMVKFSKRDKMDAVRRYESGPEGVKRIAKSLGTGHSIVLNWIKQYEKYGEKAFENRYTSYSLQDKLDVLNYMNENGASLQETAVRFAISSPGLISSWRKLWETKGVDALLPKKKGRPSMKKDKTKKGKQAEVSLEALQVENERLRAENAYLKKLRALVQERDASEHKKKQK